MLRNGAASLHGSTNVSCRIHQGRGHLSRRQLTSRAFNARVHSSIYIYISAGKRRRRIVWSPFGARGPILSIWDVFCQFGHVFCQFGTMFVNLGTSFVNLARFFVNLARFLSIWASFCQFGHLFMMFINFGTSSENSVSGLPGLEKTWFLKP